MNCFRRVGTCFVAGVYWLTNVVATHAVEKSLWEDRRSALERTPRYAQLLSAPQPTAPWCQPVFAGGAGTSQDLSIFKNLAVSFDVASAVLPYGAIGDVRSGRPGAPVVFLVQDVHGNDGAQKNIGGLLTELSAQGVTLTGVEGAWGPIDLSAYHPHPSPQAVSLVADALRSSGRLSGSEWAGLTASPPPTLVGVESPDLFHANVAAARECVDRRPDVASFLIGVNKTLQAQKGRHYSPALKAFDLHLTEYQIGREGLAAHVRFLSGLPGAATQAGAQVNKFLKAIAWESRLNFDTIEGERRALMDRLAQNLDHRALEALLARAVAYRAGKQTNGDFFSYLKTLCAKTKIPLNSYRSFADYISYVGLVQSIRRADLLEELDVWETTLGDRLAQTPQEHRLLAIDRDASLLRQLLENEMSPEAWAQFMNRRKDIVSLPGRLQEFGDFIETHEGLDAFFRPHEAFCRLAMERNGVLAANFVHKIETSKAHTTVLVTGGFHTPGLQSELLKRGYSTVVVTPRIEKVEGKPLDVFARDPLPFDKLFAGKPISLSPELLLGSLRRPLLDLAVTSESLAENQVAIAVTEWAAGRGIQVRESSLKKGVRVIQFLLSGKAISVVVGPQENLAQNLAAGTVLCEPMTFSNGNVLQMYGNIHSKEEKNKKGVLPFVFGVFRKLLKFIFSGLERGPKGSSEHVMGSNKIMPLFFLPLTLAGKLLAVPEGRPAQLPEVDLVQENGSSKFTILDKTTPVGNIIFIETGKAVVLFSLNVYGKNQGYGSSALFAVAKRAAQILNPDLNRHGRPVPFLVAEVENPWIFRFLQSQIFEPGTLEISLARSGSDVRPDSVWRNPIYENDPQFQSLTGKGNIDSKSGLYCSYFNVRGVLRSGIQTNSLDGKGSSNKANLPKGVFREGSVGFPRIEVSQQGLATMVALRDRSGHAVGKAFIGGKRGAIEMSNISFPMGDSSCAYDLVAGAAKEFLLLNGEGQILIRGVKDPMIKQMTKMLFGDTVLVAPKRVGRSISMGWEDAVGPGSPEFLKLLDDASVEVDMLGSLTQAARRSLWPNEEIPQRSLRAEERISFIPPNGEEKVNSNNDEMKIVMDGEEVGRIIFFEYPKSIVIKNVQIPNGNNNGIGSLALRNLALKAALILNPQKSPSGGSNPLILDSVKSPAILSIARKVFRRGSLRAVSVGTKYDAESGNTSGEYVNEGSEAFEQLTGSTNRGSNGDYHVHFDLTGELAPDVLAEAGVSKHLTRGLYSFSLPVLGLSVPFDLSFGFIGGVTLIVIYLGAMIYRDALLNWMTSINTSLGITKWVKTYVPDLSILRPTLFCAPEASLGLEESFVGKTVRRVFPGLSLHQAIVPASWNGSPSPREDGELLKALDFKTHEETYFFLGKYFGLHGVAADVGSSSVDGPAKGLRRGGVEKVFLVDHLHRTQSESSPGIILAPGDATALSESIGEKSMDVVLFHRSLHHIVADKETRDSKFGRYLVDRGESPEDDLTFHLDMLSHVLEEAKKSLKPGGRLLIYFASETFRRPGPPALFGWDLEDMLQEKGFQEVRVWKSERGTVLLSGVRPKSLSENSLAGIPRLTRGHRQHGTEQNFPSLVNGSFRSTEIFELVPGIRVNHRLVTDTLNPSDRAALGEALIALAPAAFEMRGVVAEVDPHRLVREERSVDELRRLLKVNGQPPPYQIPEEILNGIIQQDASSLLWMGHFSSKPLGVEALAAQVVMAAQRGDARAAGASLAAWDDSKYLASPNPAIVAETMGILATGSSSPTDVANQFAEAYNRVRVGLLFPKLMGGQLSKAGIVLNLSPLLDQHAEQSIKDQTWLALAAGLAALERDPKIPLALVVNGQDVSVKRVRDALFESVPGWGKDGLNKAHLFVESSNENAPYFVDGKFSLLALQKNVLWQRSLTVLGFSEQSILKGSNWPIEIVPLTEHLNADLSRILGALRFIQINS